MIHGDGGPPLIANNLDADWWAPRATRQFEAVQRQAVGLGLRQPVSDGPS